MINRISIEISGGHFDIINGDDFSVSDGLLGYIDGDAYRVLSNPNQDTYKSFCVTVPRYTLDDFVIRAKDCSVLCESISSKRIFCDLNNSSSEFKKINAELMGITVTKGTSRACVKSVNVLKAECGSGVLDLNLSDSKKAYRVISRHGMGEVALNGILLPRLCEDENGDGEIDIRCGTGRVKITTYFK